MTRAAWPPRQDGDRLSDVELVNLVLNVLVGGVDTTQAQLAHALRLFAEHPEQWALLRADPCSRRAPSTEVLRYEPITPFTARIAMEDIELPRRDASPRARSCSSARFTANRDGDADAERFDITARPRRAPLTFGAGIHYCLGANLARPSCRRRSRSSPRACPRPRARRRARLRLDRRHLRA